MLNTLLSFVTRLPKWLARIILLIPIIFFGGFAGLFLYIFIFGGVLSKDFPLMGLTFIVFGLFLAATLRLVAVFIGIGRPISSQTDKILQFIIAILGLIFFVGFLIFNLYDQFTHLTKEITLLRRIGFYVLAFLGIVGSSSNIVHKIKNW